MISPYVDEYRSVADIYHAAIHGAARSAYSAEQCEAWAPTPIDYGRWQQRCDRTRPWLYRQDDAVLGFIEFEDDGHIDCHYVHPDHHRQGIGSALLEQALDLARGRGLQRVHVEASHLARGLYARHGFVVEGPNHVLLRGVVLDNWIMSKSPP